MMFSFKTFYLEEAMRPLTPAEWKKPNSQTKVPRIDILRKAIDDGTPITLVNNKDVVIAKTTENMEAIVQFEKDGQKFNLKTTDGKVISSSDVGKSPMFGGGRGAGGVDLGSGLAHR